MYRARMLFVPAGHEVRWCEWLRTSDVFIGFRGWTPVLSFAWQLQVGYLDVVWKGRAYGVQAGFPPRVERIYDFSLNTVEAKRKIADVVMRSGWTFRPVIFWFQAGRSGVDTVLPTWRPLGTRVRGIIAAVSYILFLGYLIWMVGGFAGGAFRNAHNLGVLAAVTVAWWGLWSAFTWLLARLAHARRRHT